MVNFIERYARVYLTLSTRTHLEFQRFGNTITSEQIQFRLKNVKAKLDLEKKVKAGTENLLTALSKLPPDALKGSKEDKTRPELEEKIAEANFKVAMLTKAEHKYLELYVQSSSPKQDDDSLYLSDNQDRRTGRIIMRLIGAINISNRKSLKDEIYAVIKVDGSTKYTSKASKNRWDENINFQGILFFLGNNFERYSYS